MWPPLERTRRRLFGSTDDPSAARSAPVTDLAVTRVDGAGAPDDAILTLGRPELDRLGTALVALLGPATARPDTPARLEVALTGAVAALGGAGGARVDRRPAGLYTPEAWQVQLSNVAPGIVAKIRDAIRDGAFRR